MHFLALAVCFSVAVSLWLRQAPAWRLDLGQMVLWNYATASMLCLLLLHPRLDASSLSRMPWGIALALGVVLPGLFVIMGRAVQSAGIVRADIAQRLSLLLSLAAAFTLFGQRVNAWQLLGIALGLLAMLALLARPAARALRGDAALWLLAVWFGYALVDVLLKLLALRGANFGTALQSSFVLAFVCMGVAQALRLARGTRMDLRSLGGGIVLGLLNYANIDLYIRAHQSLSANPAVVFAGMNLGVVGLSALVGMLWLREPTSRLNRAGIVLAGLAIAALTRAAG
ncbi:EamA family transporter [Thiomonas sp. FB-6]|uniref:EamA family transporter n=1 Tax=Thiomonas sp. FB-6 TaxID=1158291 RepID=UPI000363DC35|nr:EamA family transporter [Thiomonas sp. FB-6]